MPRRGPTPRSRRRLSVAVAWLLLPLLAACARGEADELASAVLYEISFENRAHHEAEVEIRYTELQPGTPLELRMSRTSPGRYALHEFAKNVYDVRITDAAGAPLPVTRPDPHQWTVQDHAGEVTVRYTLYADRADGTYSGIDESHAHLNVPATFMWARSLFDRPISVTLRIPDGSGWRVATQLVPTDDPTTFTAPDHHYFLDSPIEASDFDLYAWEVGGQTIRVALHHRGTAAEAEAYVEHTKAIVREQMAVYGELPDFDHGSYTFLACYLPWVAGDGMEHRNSTILTSTGSLATSMTGLLGTVAHEFFHAWNIERIRPASLEPFDFEAANMSGALWFGEGFTSYYDDLTLARAGILTAEELGGRLGSSVNAVLNGPGRRFFSPVEMSMQAPFVDAATSVDPTNRANTFISYYTWGSVVGLGLDLSLRTRFPEVTLDDYMRALWRSFGVDERPYELSDLEAALAEVSGDPDFAADFFDRFVFGSELPDFRTLLPAAGYELRLARPGEVLFARARLIADGEGLRVTQNSYQGTPLYEAGADRGDLLLTVAGVEVTEPADLERALEGREPGDRIEVVYESRGGRRSATVALAEDPSVVVVPVEASGGEPTPEARAFRDAWLRPGG